MNTSRERNLRNVRLRSTDEEPEKAPAKRNPIAPLRAGEELIGEGLSMLQIAIAAPLRENAKAFLLLKSKCFNKQKQIEKMNVSDAENEFFPRSTRFKFELNVSKEATASDDFKILRQQTDEKILEMKRTFKSYVIRATEIEQEAMYKKLRANFMAFTRNIVKAITLTIGLDLDPDTTIITLVNKNPELLEVMRTTSENFTAEYKKIHKITDDVNLYTDIPDSTQLSQSTNQTQTRTQAGTISPYFSGQRPRTTTTTTSTTSLTQSKMSFIGNALKQAYIDPWKKYAEVYRENSLSLELSKIINTKLGEEANELTEMELDNEATLDAPTIAELITKKTNEATKNLTSEIKSLSNQVNQLKKSKKEERGQSPGGASKKKQITTKRVSFQKGTKKPTKESTKRPKEKGNGHKNTRGDRKLDSTSKNGRSKSRSSKRK